MVTKADVVMMFQKRKRESVPMTLPQLQPYSRLEKLSLLLIRTQIQGVPSPLLPLSTLHIPQHCRLCFWPMAVLAQPPQAASSPLPSDLPHPSSDLSKETCKILPSHGQGSQLLEYLVEGAHGQRHHMRNTTDQEHRSALGGHTCTVFGATGFLGRYIVNRLGKGIRSRSIGPDLTRQTSPSRMHSRDSFP
jgi:hypothetical protein